LSSQLAKVREYSSAYKGGGRDGLRSFVRLIRLLLGNTICPDISQVQVSALGTKAVIGTWDEAPLRLTNDRFLRLTMILRENKGSNPSVLAYSYQYQLEAETATDDWVFRYDFDRFPENPHPPAHLHIRGSLLSEGVLPDKTPLERLHFATCRVSLEAVIRVLIEQFGVEPVKPPSLWRPILDLSERLFHDTLQHLPSGPAQ
ncbi:MAG TPA: DUF6516 family protein, partial [Candidatus Xenobia bacterium]